MKKVIILAVFFIQFSSLNAQKYFTRNGNISFNSDAKLEKINAHNNSVTSVIDFDSGRIQFAVLIKGFIFKRALMQEHFNENYLESDKYPKSIFKGKIKDYTKIDISKDGTYNISVIGDLSIHGVTKSIEIKGSITINKGKVNALSTFKVNLEDYNISIPKTVLGKIADTIDIEVLCNYDLLE